ncbi:MAG: AI-2E family transporter [Bacteroidales bacterium]
METRLPRSIRYTFTLMGIMLSIYAIIVAREFLYPLVFAWLLAYLLFPLVNYLEKKDVPRILAIMISLILTIGLLYGASLFLFRRIGGLIDDIPVLKQQALANVDHFLVSIQDTFGIKENRLEILIRDSIGSIFEAGSDKFNHLFFNTTGALLKILLLPVYIFLFLYYRTKMAYFILKMVADNKRLVTINVLREISTVAARYMGGVFIVVICLAVMNSIGLSIIGIKYPVFFGIISAIPAFIPYFGTFIGGSIPVAFALLTMDSPMFALKIILLYYISHFIESNLLSPNIVGDQLKINPFFIIIGLIAASMVWGIPGMLVIVPVLGMLKILFENITALHPVAYMLGPKGTRKHAISMENAQKRYYKTINFFRRLKF